MKFKVICNAGSLSACGSSCHDIAMLIDADSEQDARAKFSADPVNRVYGRYIREIAEFKANA
jgi:hypothetical protein